MLPHCTHAHTHRGIQSNRRGRDRCPRGERRGKENGREGSQHTNGGGEEGRRCECVCAGKRRKRKGIILHTAVRDSTRDRFLFLVIIHLGDNVGMLLMPWKNLWRNMRRGKKGGKCYYGKDGEIERAEEGSRGLEGCRERRRRKKRKGMVV